MDTVTELTARATANLLVLQDAWALPPGPAPQASYLSALYDRLFATPALRTRALALAGSTCRLNGNEAPTTAATQRAAFEHNATALLGFVKTHVTKAVLQQTFVTVQGEADRPWLARWGLALQTVNRLLQPACPVPHYCQQDHCHLPPEQWRRLLRVVLYQDPALRVALAEALDYLPALVYNLLHAPQDARRLSAEPDRLPWQDYLLMPDNQLADALNEAGCPVPFEVVFDQELEEISQRRRANGAPEVSITDPLQYVNDFPLCALALSGGGIRSATFNLGLLQGLAGANWLRHFDYLSTVSGGGYLGAWLAAWIKREGSLQKVADRLCPDKSPTPNAEEVRPLRWLRMYSNYLNPNASIFSLDSWTLGITWLRNTLLNQVIIVLALGAVLALSSVLLHLWHVPQAANLPQPEFSGWLVAGVSTVLLLPGVWLAGLGMQMFQAPLLTSTASLVSRKLVTGLVSWAFLGACGVSWFFYHYAYADFRARFSFLGPAAGVATAALVGMAVVGRYDQCFYRRREGYVLSRREKIKAWVLIGLASGLAALLGQCGLAGVWSLLTMLQHAWQQAPLPAAHDLLGRLRLPALYYGAFMVGPPLVLEAVALTVVARMALLGANFPDERREWWGRLGGRLHLVGLTWLLVTGGLLLARELCYLLDYANAKLTHLNLSLVVTGGWLALVGKAVQLAFSARTTAQPPTRPGQSSWLDRALSLAPYVFGLGLLLLVSSALHWLLFEWPDSDSWPEALGTLPGLQNLTAAPASATQYELALARWSLLLGVALGLAAMFLGWRVGVNEFSLHHFYRNRLVRAYLGASRLRFERERTANPFTSFDRRDDLKLCALQRADPLLQPEQPGAPRPPVPPYDGPFLLINATLNATKVTDLAQQNRQAESFVFTPLYCGFDFARVRAVNPTRPTYEFGYRPTIDYAYAKDYGPSLGTAVAISGAAANPNEGYYSSPATAFLLTLFNVRLGWWMGNPSRDYWQAADPPHGLFYLLKDLFGHSDTSNRFVNLSDGGHFDNVGLYELVRRRCRYIILGDGEEDHFFTCEGLANAIRRCRVDFGVEIEIDVTAITTRSKGFSRCHHAVGTIQYPEDAPGHPSGYLLYVKTSLTGDEPTDVREYAQYNPAFPHQSTGDQFFNEAQFESYRRLGLHIFESLAAEYPLLNTPGNGLSSVFSQLQAGPPRMPKPTGAAFARPTSPRTRARNGQHR